MGDWKKSSLPRQGPVQWEGPTEPLKNLDVYQPHRGHEHPGSVSPRITDHQRKELGQQGQKRRVFIVLPLNPLHPGGARP